MNTEPVAWRWSPTFYSHLTGLRKDWQDMPPPKGNRVAGEIEYQYIEPAPVAITFKRSGSTINAKNWVTFNVWYQHADRAEALLKKGS